jgi:tetratricopeptide (TPR) repeat protein
MPRARAAAQRAIEASGPSPGPLATVACVDGLYEWAWAEAERGFLRAIEIGHDAPTAHHWFAINHLVPLGRFAEAELHLRRALEADPLSAPISVSFGLRSYFARAYETAVEEFLGTLAFDPTFPAAHFFLGLTLAELERHDEAVEQIEAAVRLSGGSPEMTAARGYIAARAGMAPAARDALAGLHALAAQRYVSPSLVAQVHAGLGDTEDALAWLERARDARATDLAWIAVRPVFDPLRGEARFTTVVRSMGLGDAGIP